MRLLVHATALISFAYGTIHAATPSQPQIQQVQFAGFDPVTKQYYVSEISNGPKPIIIGREVKSRIAVTFSPNSDRAVLAAFEQVAAHWIFSSAAINSNLSCDARLRMTLLVYPQNDSNAVDTGIQQATLRDWKLDFPFSILVDHPVHTDFLSAQYLADSPEVVLGKTLFKEIPGRHFTLDPEKAKAFDTESAKASPYSLSLKTHLTAAALQALLQETSTAASGAPTKLQHQIEALHVLISKLEQPSGGCLVSPQIDMGEQRGFTINPPSLAAAGGPACDHVLQIFLTRVVTPEEWQQTKSEFNRLKQEQEASLPRARSLRKAATPLSADDVQFLQHVKQLGRRMIAIDNPIDGLPMARFKSLGLIIIPSLDRPSGAPPISVQSVQAREAFYRQLATVVDFYDLEAVISLIRE